MKAIIITTSEEQVEKLHLKCRNTFNNTGFWGEKQLDYDTEWIWILNDKDLSGTSSPIDDLRHKIKQYPGFKIYHYPDFAKENKL